MPVGEKWVSVAVVRGVENSRPAGICDSTLPLGASWGGADAEKPLEENEAVIRSCPAGTNAASVTDAVILTLLPCSLFEISNQSYCAQVGWSLYCTLPYPANTFTQHHKHVIRVDTSLKMQAKSFHRQCWHVYYKEICYCNGSIVTTLVITSLLPYQIMNK